MDESDYQVLFKHYLEKERPLTATYELKICHGNALPFSAVKEHQVNALLEAEEKGFYHKISDSSFGLKPFDCLFLSDPRAFVAILYHIPRKRKKMAIIPIQTFLHEKECSESKSLSFKRAGKIAEIFTDLP